MTTHSISFRSLCWMTTFSLLATRAVTAAQTPAISQTPVPGNSYRIAGTVVSKVDAHPLARARITVRDAKDEHKFEFLVTSDDGRFQFSNVPAGKYSLTGAKRGFITASYEQHEQFSSAIVTGAGIDTETLVLRLAPTAIISGKVLDEAGEPVRHATVTSYFDDHSSGVDQIRQSNITQTDDLGAYEITSLMPGTYFLSATAKPWYAVHPISTRSGSSQSADTANADGTTFDRSLDVAYPLTYYADVTEADSAAPIPIRGGERLQVEIHLNPVPALHLLFRVHNNGNRGDIFPRLEQPAFDGSTFLQSDNVRTVSPGLVEITGVPAGRYNVRFYGAGSGTQMNGVDLNRDGEELDTSTAEALSTVKMSVHLSGETSLPPRLTLALQSAHRSMAGVQQVNPQGEVEFQQIPAGRYEVLLWGPLKPYSIAHISAEGAEVSGHSLTVAPGSSPEISLTLVGGSVNVEGIAKHAGKPFAGAMVVLVPKNPETDRQLFRRDQSDLDGTFSLRNVVPGSYTLLAIENGWDLEWSQPAVIAAYLRHGRTIEVGNQVGSTVNFSEAVEVQSK
jgi:Carboxypeptidase regulatory-like domain